MSCQWLQRVVLMVLALSGLEASRPLRVHVMPHTHADVGYKKQFEGYFLTEVRPILLSVTEALQQRRDARFVWSEVAWLKRWFEGSSDSVDREAQARFRSLLAAGQIELVDGGFSQHDDAVTTVEQQLQNMRQGRQWLIRKFGEACGRPRYGWHPDSFGSTSFTPSLYALLGCDAVVHDRMNDDKKAQLAQERNLEFLWEGSTQLSVARSRLLTHIINGQLHTGYQSPVGFDWEPDQSPSPSVNHSSVQMLSDQYVSVCLNRSAGFRHESLLMPFGMDFRFRHAEPQFGNFTQIRDFVNSHPERYIQMFNRTVSIRYSTMHEYFSDVRTQQPDFQVFSGSLFMPFYMQGYYSNNPTLKQGYRHAMSLLEATDRWVTAAVLTGTTVGTSWLDAARSQIALISHHDGIPVTGYSFYTADCLRRLEVAISLLKRTLLQAVGGLQPLPGLSVMSAQDDTSWVCPSMGASDSLLLLNSAGHAREAVVTVFACLDHVIVSDSTGALPVQAHRVLDRPGAYSLLIGPLSLAATSIHVLTVRPAMLTTNTDDFPELPSSSSVASNEFSGRSNSSGTLENSRYLIRFSNQHGLESVLCKATGRTHALTLSWVLYSGLGSNSYSFNPPSDASATLSPDSFEWFSSTGPTSQRLHLRPRGLGLSPNSYKLSADDVVLKEVVVELSEADGEFIKIAHTVQLSRGADAAGRNLVLRLVPFDAAATSCNWTVWENGYERDVLGVVTGAPEAAHRPLVSTAGLECANSDSARIVVEEGHGHVVRALGERAAVEVMLHRRTTEGSPSAADYRGDYLKGDDSSEIETALWIGFPSVPGDDFALAELRSKLALPVTVLKASTMWDWGLPAQPSQTVGSMGTIGSLLVASLPPNVDLAHLSCNKSASANSAATVFVTLMNKVPGEAPVVFPVQDLLVKGSQIVNVTEMDPTFTVPIQTVQQREMWGLESGIPVGCLRAGATQVHVADFCSLRLALSLQLSSSCCGDDN